MKTPLIYDKVLWERSGHWEKFRENMFLIPEDDHTFAIKPMNCPGHMVLFADTLRSYRELPLRYAEAAPLHRNERAGTLHGLTRVRHVTQDDAHIFCTREQIEDEIFGCLDYAKFIYDLFDLEAEFELSTRPENRLGTDEEWDFTEGALKAALDRRGLAYDINEGDGAFYGPKIDLSMRDSLGRSWQMGTIQLDSQQPARLNCRYVGADNAEHVPYVVHRALMGSFERFIGILTEHYAGAFPFWIAPVQIRVLPVGEGHREAAQGPRRAACALPGRGGRLRRHRREADPQRRGGQDPVRDRLRGQGERRFARDPGARRGADHPLSWLISGQILLLWSPWQAGAEPSLTS